jgi:hypothetical protein
VIEQSVAGSDSLRGGAIAIALIAIVIAGTAALLYGPALSFALTGDSYQWIQHAHLAAHRPALLLADLDTFYRPSTTWTLVADRFVWGGFDAPGYRTTSLLLHGIVALALAIAGRRLGLGWIAAAAVGVIWLASPFTDESAFIVAYRFQPLLLLSWLVLIAAWPQRGERWSGLRLAIVIAAVFGAAAAKETWVVTPVLVAALANERERKWRAVLTPVIAVGCAVAVYLIFYFISFPTSKSYFESGPHIIAKIPTQLAAFFLLEESIPHDLSLTIRGALAFLAFSTAVFACVKWRVPGALVAVVLFLLPTLPTLLVPYMPQRYLAIPFAGFLLLVALWIQAVYARQRRWRPMIRGIACVSVVVVLAVGASTVRADLEDHRTMAAAHAVLLGEAREVAAAFVDDTPVAVIRDEGTTPLVEVVQSPVGYPKIVFIRNYDPYGLIDAAALFEWVLADEARVVEHVGDWTTASEGVEGVLLVHRDGEFVNLGVTENLAEQATRWSDSGRGVQVVRASSLHR